MKRMPPSSPFPSFFHGPEGMVRFPLNVETLRFELDDRTLWFVAQRNEIELRFPMRREDCEHLASLALKVPETTEETDPTKEAV